MAATTQAETALRVRDGRKTDALADLAGLWWMRFHGVRLPVTGQRLGIPVELSLVGPEPVLYDTDPKFESFSGRSAANSGTDAR
jgi:hypothetical protein